MPGGGEYMNRNVSIIVVLLVLVVIAGYLIWLRNKVQPVVYPKTEEQVQVAPTATPTMSASPSATPSGKEATGAVKQKSSSPSSTKR